MASYESFHHKEMSMNKLTKIAFTAALVLAFAGVNAGEYATKAEAEAMVKKAVEAIKADKKTTLDQITSKNAKWVDRDLYAVVYDMTGAVRAHGQNEKMVGKDLSGFKDPDGKLFVKERMDLAASKGKFWHDYKFTDPTTKKALPKEAYCEKTDDLIVCAGVYKR
jgi:signal transduction histidine kinase